MNEWMNEWLNEWMIEWMNEYNEWMKWMNGKKSTVRTQALITFTLPLTHFAISYKILTVTD